MSSTKQRGFGNFYSNKSFSYQKQVISSRYKEDFDRFFMQKKSYRKQLILLL